MKAEMKLDEERLHVLQKLRQIKDANDEEFLKYALEECVQLNSIPIGYMHFVNPDQETLDLNIWSENTHKHCGLLKKILMMPFKRRSISVLTRIYLMIGCCPERLPELSQLKKTCWTGKFEINRHMRVPVIDGR